MLLLWKGSHLSIDMEKIGPNLKRTKLAKIDDESFKKHNPSVNVALASQYCVFFFSMVFLSLYSLVLNILSSGPQH